jgi:hypothetical protein
LNILRNKPFNIIILLFLEIVLLKIKSLRSKFKKSTLYALRSTLYALRSTLYALRSCPSNAQLTCKEVKMSVRVREESLMRLEAVMLGQNLFEAQERLKVKREGIVGKPDLISGLLDFLVESQIWSRLRKMYDDVGQKSSEDREEALETYRALRCLNLKWEYLVSESEEWAAYRLVNADFRDDDTNLASIQLSDQSACCQSKLSKTIEMFRGTIGVAGLSLYALRQLRSHIEREIYGGGISYSGIRGCELENERSRLTRSPIQGSEIVPDTARVIT